MNASKNLVAALVTAAVGMAGLAGTAGAARPVDGQLSGKVTDVRGNDTIYVEGKPYKVQPNSAASKVLGKIRVGTQVHVALSGAPGDPKSQITGIVPHEQP
jgi:hypothetical protein